ncbi:MAG: CxxC-x17-CxxC domain-containing protein [Clostridia bacterium]
MYDVVCDSCGRPTQVPFQPRGDRPVYCRDCFDQQRQSRY